MTCKILLPVDGSEGSLRAARHVAQIACMLKDIEIHLVNVQPPGDDWMVRRMIKPDELARMEKEWAETALSPARTVFQASSIAVIEHAVQGDIAKAIVELAQALACDQIVMGTRGLGVVGNIVMGSVANKVLHLTQIPVTLVK